MPFKGLGIDKVVADLRDEGWEVFDTSSGFPDLFCVRGSEHRLVEVKGGDDRLRPNQIETIRRLEGLGVAVDVAYSLEERPKDYEKEVDDDDALTTIQVTKGTRERLKALRIVPQEPLNNVIVRILDELDGLRKAHPEIALAKRLGTQQNLYTN